MEILNRTFEKNSTVPNETMLGLALLAGRVTVTSQTRRARTCPRETAITSQTPTPGLEDMQASYNTERNIEIVS